MVDATYEHVHTFGWPETCRHIIDTEHLGQSWQTVACLGLTCRLWTRSLPWDQQRTQDQSSPCPVTENNWLDLGFAHLTHVLASLVFSPSLGKPLVCRPEQWAVRDRRRARPGLARAPATEWQ